MSNQNSENRNSKGTGIVTSGSQWIANITREAAQPGAGKQQPPAAIVVGWTAEEMEKEVVAVLQVQEACDAHPPLPPPLAMVMISEEEIATALHRFEVDAVDAARQKWLVDKLEKEGAKQ